MMWQHHFYELYNTISDNSAKCTFYDRLKQMAGIQQPLVLTVSDVADICESQKRNKASGPDGIAMEAFVFCGYCLYVHLSMLFNLFLHFLCLNNCKQSIN